MGSLKKGLFEFFLFNRFAKRLSILLLRSRFAYNPLYNFFYSRQIRAVMKNSAAKPNHVVIENTNSCNSDCITCCRAALTRKIGFMDLKLFKKIIDDCVDAGVDFVSISSFGEPFLDPKIVERIEYAKKSGIKRVWLNSNGSVLKEKLARELINSGLDELYISVDAATKQTYEKIRRGLNYGVLEKNILDLVELKKELNSKTPRLILDFVEIKENSSEVNEFLSKWRGVVDEICITTAHNWAGQKKDISLDDFHSGRAMQWPCRMPWRNLVICWDGRVPVCCHDINGELILGDLNKESILDVWSGKPVNRVRQMHSEKRFSELPVCKGCKYTSVWWFQ